MATLSSILIYHLLFSTEFSKIEFWINFIRSIFSHHTWFNSSEKIPISKLLEPIRTLKILDEMSQIVACLKNCVHFMMNMREDGEKAYDICV